MKALIIEDERPIAQALEKKIHEMRPDLIVVGITSNISDSIEAIRANNDLDIIFSDIKIDDGLSFAIFERVHTNAMIVFTTAYDEYALQAFDYNCIDYLLKPIEKEALNRALTKCETHKNKPDWEIIQSLASQITSPNGRFRKRLFLELGRDTIICNVNQVCYIYTEKGVTTAYLSNGLYGLIDNSLSDLIGSLPPDRFVRINRQVIVNIEAISRITKGEGRESTVVLSDPYPQKRFSITAERKKELLELIQK